MNSPINRVVGHGQRLLSKLPDDVLYFCARFFIAAVFWQSGRTKMAGWQLNDTAIYLFQEEYKLPLLAPEFAARAAAFSEHFFPLLLVLGIASRLSALALLAMTMVIEVFVYPEAWPTHGVWAVSLLVIVAKGPGRWSGDHLLARRRLTQA